MYKPVPESKRPQASLPDKLFYKIGEISKITGVEAYVLRYWETEFPFLRPRKNKSGQRVYVRKDLELVLKLKRLLYEERYTIEGVRKKFGEGNIRASEHKTAPEPKQIEPSKPSSSVEFITKRLREILKQLS